MKNLFTEEEIKKARHGYYSMSHSRKVEMKRYFGTTYPSSVSNKEKRIHWKKMRQQSNSN